MAKDKDMELLKHTLEYYYNANAFTEDWIDLIKSYLIQPKFPDLHERFKKQLVLTIQNNLIAPEEYERLTETSLDTQEEVNESLKELWFALYGREPIQ